MMLYFLLIIGGTVLGVLLFDSFEGLLSGGFLGWLTALVFQLKSRVSEQHLLINDLANQLRKPIEQHHLTEESLTVKDSLVAKDSSAIKDSAVEGQAIASAGNDSETARPAEPEYQNNTPPGRPPSNNSAFNLNLHPNSLPRDIANQAYQLWQQDKHAEAITLLYRASLSRLHHFGHMPVNQNATEGDYVSWVKNNCDKVLYLYFQQLTAVWQASAYAHQIAENSVFNELCSQWFQRFDAPLEAAKALAATNPSIPSTLEASADIVSQPTGSDRTSSGHSSNETDNRFAQHISHTMDLVKAKTIDFFSSGNLLVKVGVLILFFGVAFLLKYAAERTVVPVEFRYLGIMTGAMVMLLFGWRLRRTHLQYALVMQGGAIGILYLVVFAAYQLHDLLQPTIAMGLMLLIVTLAAAIAILQNAKWLAAVAVTGGFLAPVLASSGSGSHTGLFSYFLVLNLSIVAIAFYRSWRLLNWLGFIFTFGIATLWGARYYTPDYFHSTEPFLIGFFLIYTLIPFLYASRQPPKLRGLVDGTLIFGTPVAFMGLQSQLADGYGQIPHLMALSSAALGAMYLLLASLIRRKQELFLLCESYVALAIAFLTLAVPLGFDGRVTSSTWAIEGAALIWVGFRQQRLLPRISGLGLILVSAFFYFQEPADSEEKTFLLNADFMGSLLLAVASLYAARLYAQFQALTTPFERHASLLLLLWGFGWWFGGGLQEIDRHFNGLQALFGFQIMVALTSALGWLAGMRLRSLPLCGLSLLSAATGMVLLIDLHHYEIMQSMWLNLNFASASVLAGLLLWMAVTCWQQKYPEGVTLAMLMQYALVWIGTLTLLAFGYLEMQQFQSPGFKDSFYLLFAVVLLMLIIPAHQRIKMPALTQPVLMLLPLLAGTFLLFAEQDYHLTAWLGWLSFPVAVVALFVSLRYLEQLKDPETGRAIRYPLGYFHLCAVLVLTFALAWQFGKLFRPARLDGVFGGGSHWVIAVWGLSFSLVLVGLHKLRQLTWPMQRYPFELTVLLPRILLGLLASWLLLSNLRQPGELSIILSYIPLLNPIDTVNLVALLIISLWLNRIDREFFDIQPQLRLIIPAALAFLWANAALLRGFHYLLDIPFRFEPMFRSIAVESGLSILWSTIALVTMVIATRRGWRILWLVGGALMGVVVIKLFTVDMAGTGTIARIIGFITVGALLLLVGYMAPVPPKNTPLAGDGESPSPPGLPNDTALAKENHEASSAAYSHNTKNNASQLDDVHNQRDNIGSQGNFDGNKGEPTP